MYVHYNYTTSLAGGTDRMFCRTFRRMFRITYTFIVCFVVYNVLLLAIIYGLGCVMCNVRRTGKKS
jgi:hypothetical protein